MDTTEEIREEETMSGNIKIIENKKGVIQQKQKIQRNLKEKISEPSLDKLNSKDMKIKLPLSQSDDHSLSNISRLSQDDFKIPKKEKTKIIPGPLVKAPKVTQDQYDMEKNY